MAGIHKVGILKKVISSEEITLQTGTEVEFWNHGSKTQLKYKRGKKFRRILINENLEYFEKKYIKNTKESA